MTDRELSGLLKTELNKRAWSVSDLARNAKMNRETARRAVFSIGKTSLDHANQLLAAVDHELVAELSMEEGEVSA